MQFTPENQRKFEEILGRYPVKRSALVPALALAQQQEGYLHDAAIRHVASLLGLSPAQVHDTASFYSMFAFEPQGETLIEVCTTLSCTLNGAEGVLQSTCRKLGIQPGQTTPDRKFTVKRVECLAACGGAPAVQVNGEWLEHASEADLDRVLAGEKLRRKFEWPKSPGEHVIFKNVWKPGSASLGVYEAGGGYRELKKFLGTPPEAIIEEVKKANLRGRGGAGFPTGMKWGFLPKDDKPRYLCVNADESEPGTYKDRVILENDPHQLIEGTVVTAHAIKAKLAYIYIRGEFHEGYATLDKALREARAAGYVGKNILGSGVDVEVHIHRGAGSYECGEETALIESLEGKRGQPRVKPPFPAIVGLYGCPTIVNNVETIAMIPLILGRGADWFASVGVEKNGGPKLYCVSGHVERPGIYEAPVGRVSLRELIFGEGYARGIRGGKKLKAVIPGGSSTPVLLPHEIDVNMDLESLQKAGSALGSAGTIVMDEETCMVSVARNLAYFYKDESCGKCTPCREGTGWMLRLLTRMRDGGATARDTDSLLKIIESIAGKTVCAFGDGAIAPIGSILRKFRPEFDWAIANGGSFKRVARTFEDAQAAAPAATPAAAAGAAAGA
jgi:NADH-quinone oxidoreductase subunit F